MKNFLLFFCVCIMVLIVHTMAFGADVPLTWDAPANASGYKIYTSIDNGLTWDAGLDVGDVTIYTYPGVSETGLVLFRVSAYNAAGEAIRYWSGAWYNKSWMPPQDASALGIE